MLAAVAVTLSLGAKPSAVRPADWVPARWLSHDIRTLDLLNGHPVNCILLEPADWDASFIDAATARGLVPLGVTHPGSDLREMTRRAGAVKLTGLVAEGDFETASPDTGGRTAGFVRVNLPSRARIALDSGDPISGTNQGLWPGLEIEHNGKSITGPTSAPWINTNGGFLRFLRARTGATVWLATDPPRGLIFPVERYLQAIGDAAIPGARWVISLDSDFEKRLYRHDPAAVKDWGRIGEYLRFYERWRAANFGRFGVVMDRTTGGLLSGFLLDMLAAQRASATVIPPGRVTGEALQQVKVLLDLDGASLSADERTAIKEFVARGGTVLEPPPSVGFPEPSTARITPDRRDLDRLQGLWEMVYNATLRKNFGVRAFNTAGIMTGVSTPDGGRSVIVHLLNFTDYPGESISVHALGAWKRARLHRPDGPDRELTIYPVKEGTAVDVEGFGTAVAIHFE